MKKILGLDLGTTSIGWALVKEAEIEEEKSSIIKLGVRVNPLTVDEQSNFEKAKPLQQMQTALLNVRHDVIYSVTNCVVRICCLY